MDDYETDVLNTFSNEEFRVDTEVYTNSANMDVAYRNEKGTAHVHAPHAIEDKAPTCTQPGYTGRTWCDVCDSPVEWGTVIPATGHDYQISGENIVCNGCGETITGTGVINIGEDTYYLMDGKLTRGWQSNAYVYFYFRSNYKAAKGPYAVGGVVYPFDEETGLMNTGAWVTNEKGTRYSYGPGYYVRSWREIDGKTYYFGRDTYMYTGVSFIKQSPNTPPEWYVFGEDGVYDASATVADGLYEIDGDIYYCKDGSTQFGLQLVDGDYYYFKTGSGFLRVGYAARSETYYVSNTNGLTWANGVEIEKGSYEFGADGKMIIPEPKNGPQEDGFFYIDDVKQRGYQLIEYNGTFYFIGDYNKIVVNKIQYLSAESLAAVGLELPEGKYQFDEEGRLTFPDPRNGLINGIYYVDDVAVPNAGLIFQDGAYYYINDNGKPVTDRSYYVAKTNGLVWQDDQTPIEKGTYTFDAEGRLIRS